LSNLDGVLPSQWSQLFKGLVCANYTSLEKVNLSGSLNQGEDLHFIALGMQQGIKLGQEYIESMLK
jgi:hypothetical protein